MIYSTHNRAERTRKRALLPSNFVYIKQREIETCLESSLSSHYTLLNWFINPWLCSAPFIQSGIKDAWDERAPRLISPLACQLAAAFGNVRVLFVGPLVVSGSGGGSWHVCADSRWWSEIYTKRNKGKHWKLKLSLNTQGHSFGH